MNRDGIGEFAKRYRTPLAISAAALLSGVAVAGYVAHKRRPREDEPLLSGIPEAEMRSRLAIFDDEGVEPEVRGLLPTLAARIYFATDQTEGHVMTGEMLLGEFEVDGPVLNAGLDCLSTAGLINVRVHDKDATKMGYYAEAPLLWVVRDDEQNLAPALQQAVADILSEQSH